MFQTTKLNSHFEELAENKWTVLTLPAVDVNLIRDEAFAHLKKNEFRPAELANFKKVVSEIRNDVIYWLDPTQNTLTENERTVLKKIDFLRQQLKNYFRIALDEFECHYAHYQKGHYYQRHLDTTSINNKRFFSFVIYLNSDWSEQDGGQLLGYHEDEVLFSLKPELGNMILFRSDLPHEVLPTQKDRLSLTGWFRKLT